MAHGLARLAAVATATAVASAWDPPDEAEHPHCQNDAMDVIGMVARTCNLNWALTDKDPHVWELTERMGCWRMLAYNTDSISSSAVFHNTQDGRCMLAMSGYHALLRGYANEYADLNAHHGVKDVCGFKGVFKPFYSILHHHTRLQNWTRLVEYLVGTDSPCKGDIWAGAESLGGAMLELLAGCANKGLIHKIQPQSVPNFTVAGLYTFGSPGSAREAITNRLRKDRCFPGKRFHFVGDYVSYSTGLMGFKHARMGSMELWHRKEGTASVRSLSCRRSANQEDVAGLLSPAPEPVAHTGDLNETDPHSIFSYEEALIWLHEHNVSRALVEFHRAFLGAAGLAFARRLDLS